MPIDHIQNSTVKDEFEKIFLFAEKIEELWSSQGNALDIIGTSYDLENKPQTGDAFIPLL